MKNKAVKRILATGLAAVLAVSMLAGCGGKDKGGSSDEKSAEFGWWITKTDAEGEYYESYEESPIVQYIHAQYWDSENGGIGDEKTGKKLKFSFVVPITGSEKDNFNTMISTGEYPEILDLNMASDSPQAMYDNGITLDLTEYVEKYMPNYLAYLDENPELKPFVQVKDEDGKVHYYAIYALAEGVEEPWQGHEYRRDWVAKYAEPTDYVWDWESDCVKENGHPEVTPLAKAKAENNLEGWKKNEVKKFEYNYNVDNELGYEDNIIFPSGKSDPITISDWEWMFEAFDKAIADRGWADDSSAYCFSIPYAGCSQTGDVVSSFGGGTGQFSIKDGKALYSATSDNFKTYVECVTNWYQKGWLDTEFNTRAADMFWKINTPGRQQGKVGLWQGQTSEIGKAIRTSCQNAEDAQDAYVAGCALPINDIYGGEEHMYKEPDALFQMSRKGAATALTKKAEGKDMATLFTFFDWTYSHLGSMTMRHGMNEEQYQSMKFDPDLYGDHDLPSAYTTSKGEDGRTVYKRYVDTSSTMVNAVNGQRMDIGLKPCESDEYIMDLGTPPANQAAYIEWKKYINTANVLDYRSLFNVEESDLYNKTNQALLDIQQQNLPKVIKGEMTWEDYVKSMDAIDAKPVVKSLQKYVDLSKK